MAGKRGMGWSIGRVVGSVWQPDSFSDKSSFEAEIIDQWGTTAILQSKQMAPREVTITFLVDVNECAEGPDAVYNAFRYMQKQQLVGNANTSPQTWPVTLGSGDGFQAFIMDVTLERTHTEPHGRCVRGIISVTVREAVNQGAGGVDRGAIASRRIVASAPGQ